MKLSILTCSYNNLEGLKAAVEEVGVQSSEFRVQRSEVSGDLLEHVIIDGGSTDGTVEWLEETYSESRLQSEFQSGVHNASFRDSRSTQPMQEGTNVSARPSPEGSGRIPTEVGTPNVRLRWISEPDQGLYDALNKGLRMATGDVIGILHTDDVWEPGVLKRVWDAFESSEFRVQSSEDPPLTSDLRPPTSGIDGVYGDLLYVDADDITKVKRVWRSGSYDKRKWWNGWMPPHPALFVTRELVGRVGEYRLDLGSAADYEWMLRAALVHDATFVYVSDVEQKGAAREQKGAARVFLTFFRSRWTSSKNVKNHGLTPFAPFESPFVRMRVGGQSNVSTKARLKANAADRKAWEVNGLKPRPWTLYMKPIRKLPQWLLAFFWKAT